MIIGRQALPDEASRRYSQKGSRQKLKQRDGLPGFPSGITLEYKPVST
jgi:hypothetical protein